ncbi:HET-domain-containing protein [Westerdykella ornata]|uniref:HET-domain-containing protein n=1 Tax=Westerdykella ornata TaxID=318751 RepID=A0A6A6JXA3_WESOR|nr:HET-domain-containing protein [Westerdykella ornata]KAF2280703.1 HET-domain-containing protein [Westerdykella ornata]
MHIQQVARRTSQISLATIDPEEIEPFRDDWEHDTQPLAGDAIQARGHDATAAPAPADSSSLCTRCQNFDVQSFARSANRRKGYLLRDVQAAANQGCSFCALLLEALEGVEKPEYFYNNLFVGRTTLNPDLYVHMTVSESYYDDRELCTSLSMGLSVNRILVELGDRFSGVRNQSKHEVCIAADPGSPAVLNGDIVGRYIGNDPSSASHYETARNWLQACSSHSKCNQRVSGSVQIDPYHSPLPTRVVEITRENNQQRLYLRQTEGLNGAYITLTHRWNEFTGKCITTTSNYEERLLGGDFGELPQLFRDALTIAEKLNIKFIWIDSICIIQQGDNLADWRREAPKMAQYYQFSVFTLAGTAEDMTGGLLQPYPRDSVPWASKLVRLPYRDKAGAVAGDFYAYIRRVPLVGEYMDQVRSSILFRRGWILQEWLLSKRLLWYTPNGLFFECQQELPRSYDQAQIAFGRAGAELQAHLQLKASFHFSNSDILSFWYHALEVYSGQHLTKPELDRILAVGGLAKEVAQILADPERLASRENEAQNEVYVAGLWLRDIYHGLLWEKEHHASEQDTKTVDKTPSWSWASLLTLVRWPERSKGTKSAFTVTGLCFTEREAHEIPDHVVFDGCKLRPFNAMTERPTFDPANMFSCLHIRGKLHTVHIRGYLETEENLKKAALSTGYSPIPEACNWRAICSAFQPDIIAGWGSLERLQPRYPSACDDFGIAVYALHVSTRYLRHGVWVKRQLPVLDVLFLEEVVSPLGTPEQTAERRVSNRFRRLGIGRIADEGLIAEFEEAGERDIQLI